jgi:monothiol glutaredoxin
MSNIAERIEKLLTDNKVVLFMKGTPDAPMCGFSARASGILQHLDVQFTSVNILADGEIREGIKAYGNWPTIPQLYVSKNLVGGSDIMMEMLESGELEKVLKA